MSYIFYDAKVVAETDRAVCISHDDLDEEMWIPKLMIVDSNRLLPDSVEDIEVKDSWARREGWI